MTTIDSHLEEVSLILRISRLAQQKLTERAAQRGEDLATVASELISNAIMKPTIDEILAPVRAEFEASGLTDSQIMELGRDLVGKVRAGGGAEA